MQKQEICSSQSAVSIPLPTQWPKYKGSALCVSGKWPAECYLNSQSPVHDQRATSVLHDF